LWFAPPAAKLFIETFLPDQSDQLWVTWLDRLSPLATAFTVPQSGVVGDAREGDWRSWFACVGGYLLFNAALVGTMLWRFKQRWRVTP
jgi:hypothetical protein